MNKGFLFLLATLLVVPIGFVDAENSYLGDKYTVVLQQFKEVWVETNMEGCSEDTIPCAYWDREYDDPVRLYHGDTAALELNKKTTFSFEGPKPPGVECDIFIPSGELFFINADQTRQSITDFGWGGFEPKVGTYEIDGYATCAYQARNDLSLFHRIFAWLKPSVAYAAPDGEYIGTIRFDITDKSKPPVPLTLPEKAAALAKKVIGADYLGDGETFGGKGWDINQKNYVNAASIFGGYNYWNNKSRKVTFGSGLDCSGLVEWAYNYSFDPQKSLTKNAIRTEGADGQYRKNSVAIEESEISKGDLLFLDKNNNNHVDHVAMYVGEFINEGDIFEIVEAFAPGVGVVPTTFRDYINRPGFTNIVSQGSSPTRRVVISPEIAGQAKVGSPVDISVTTPDGINITPDTFIQTDEEYLREVPGELYYSEREFGEDGRPQDTIYWFENKVGDYLVKVTPEKGTQPTNTYSLEITINGNTVKLAEDVAIGKIPVAGYYVKVGESGEVESSGVIESGYLLDKIKTHINSFDANNGIKKPLFAMVGAIEKRLEINRKLQDKLTKYTEKLKENEQAILRELSFAETIFAEKAGQKVTDKEKKELLVLLTKVLLTFN
jgi:cell wall-associated NlpC family hydrolase